MHEVIVGRFDQTSQTVPNFVAGVGSQNLSDQGQRPNVPLARVRTPHPIDLSSGVEELILLREDEPSSVLIDTVLDVHKF
jgi:hypothetical protein